MKLRTSLLLGIITLVAALIAATVLTVTVVVEQAARTSLEDSLGRTRRVFEDLLGYRRSVYLANCRIVANEPRLRATVATPGVNRATIDDVVAELRTSHGSDLFLLTDETGAPISTASVEVSGDPTIAAALANGEAAGVWIARDRAYQVQACRIDFGPDPFAVVVIGHVVDDSLLRTVERQTGTAIAVLLDDGVTAAALPDGEHAELTAAGAAPTQIALGGNHYVALASPFPSYAGDRELRYVVARSLDEALAPARRLTRNVLAIAAGAILAALALAFVLSRRLSRPVDQLVQFTDAIARGDLHVRARPVGATELQALATAMNRMVAELDRSRSELSGKQRLEREMEIAMNIQTSILPKSYGSIGLDISAKMLPATEVGGDYYDILPTADGCWLGIGDVAGHGLTAGLEMLMVQSVLAALVRKHPDATPKDQLEIINHVLYDNIRNRLRQDEHVTLTLLRYRQGGLVTFAGAHEDILVCRSTGPCERIATPGTWVGAMPDVARVTRNTSIALEVNDLMVLYSDGLTEARDAGGEQFGIERVCSLIEEHRDQSVEVVRDAIVDAVERWQARRDDDITVVVARRRIE